MFPIILYGLKNCDKEYRFRVLSGKRHTYYRVTYEHHCSLDHDIMAVYDNFYKSLNPFDPQSVISKVNKNENVVLDDVFIRTFGLSMNLAGKTGGVFDPTCAPLINLWGFGYEKIDEAIDDIKKYVGYNKIKIEEGRVIKTDPRMQLNFSAIGDGFACEIIGRCLDEKGVKNYMVDIGGEIIVKGKNRTGIDWSVGIIKPPKYPGVNEPSGFEAILHLKGRSSLATSGNYNNFRIRNGKRYGHAINPLTGYPTNNGILSATVIAPDCVTADAYATAIMSVEKDKLDKLLQTCHLLEYYIIYKDNADNYHVKLSDGMRVYTR